MYISPSLDATALTAAPYRGKGLDWGVGKLRRRCDQGYSAALGTCCPLRVGRACERFAGQLTYVDRIHFRPLTPESDSDRFRGWCKPGPFVLLPANVLPAKELLELFTLSPWGDVC